MNKDKWFLNGGRGSGRSFRLLWETYENKIAELEKENAKLKAMISIWHDLRKDPNDLPKEEKTVQVLFKDCDAIKEYNCVYDIQARQWLYYNIEELVLCSFDYTVVAWCELPKFREE